MIAEWRKELSNLMNESIDKIVEIINQEFYLDIHLTDYERRNFSKRIKKYGVKETLESSLIAFERYDDIETALSKIDGILDISDIKLNNGTSTIKLNDEIPILGTLTVTEETV